MIKLFEKKAKIDQIKNWYVLTIRHFVAGDFMLILAIVGAGGGIVIVVIILTIIGLCRRSTTQKQKKTKREYTYIM